MAAEIGPGTLLECIRQLLPRDEIQVGRVYVCRAVDPRPFWVPNCFACGTRNDGVELAEIPDELWCMCQFRPLPPRSKHVDAMLERLSKPERILEPA